MGTRMLFAAAGIGMAMLLAQPLAGQEAASRRQGFWFSAGIGYGGTKVGCSGCGPSDREDGVTGMLALGGAMGRHLRLGGESDVWIKKLNGVNTTLGTLALTAFYYPEARGNFFFKGGAGLAQMHLSGFGQSEDHTGGGLLLGVGVDVPLGPKWSFTPTLSFNSGFFGRVDGTDGVFHNTVQLGGAITLH